MKKFIALFMAGVAFATLTSCNEDESKRRADTEKTLAIASKLQSNQPTPTDIDYSLERYNLIKRAYWVNGNREKANALPCEIEKPLGYIVLLIRESYLVSLLLMVRYHHLIVILHLILNITMWIM